MKRCFFIGHRDSGEAIYSKLLLSIEKHIKEYGIKEFLIGRYGNFDILAARAVLQLKEKYPFIRLTMLSPYHPASRSIETPLGFDGIYYPFDRPIPPKTAIIEANKKVIRQCDCLIAYVCHPGKTRDFLNYAEKSTNKSISIDNLAE